MQSSQRVTVGVALVFLAAVAVVATGVAPGVAAQEANGTDEGESTFGAQVSAFMQSSAADANGTVDRAMWAGTVANGSDPGAAVSERARELEERVAALEARSTELAAQANESGTGDIVYTARASAVRAELANLRQSVNQTVATAASHGVDDEGLADLRERAGSVSGPEVAAAARNLTSSGGGPPEWVPGNADEPGPPSATPGPGTGNESDGDGPGNGSAPGDPGNGGDAPGNSGDEPGNSGDAPGDGGDGGPPDEGNGNPPEDPGNAGGSDDAGSGDDPGNSGDSPGNSDDSADGDGDDSDEENGGGVPGNSGNPGNGNG